MGKAIVIGNEKGGVGKSTVACNLAITLMNDGHDVLLIDTDRQGSLGDFSGHRKLQEGLSKLNTIQKSGDTYDAVVDMKSRYDFVIIDAGGQDSIELRSSLMAANLLIMPLKASQFDLWACERMEGLLKRVKSLNRGLINKTLINMASTNQRVKEGDEAHELLSGFEIINSKFAASLKERKAYRDSIKRGQSILEFDKKSKASEEFTLLYKEIKNVIH
jgi:chromosome partitioning protein